MVCVIAPLGYECVWEPNEDDTYSQRDIRANHLAIVEKGRAGERVRIEDYAPPEPDPHAAFEAAAARYHRANYHVRSDREPVRAGGLHFHGFDARRRQLRIRL
jgi:hypothetical protein